MHSFDAPMVSTLSQDQALESELWSILSLSQLHVSWGGLPLAISCSCFLDYALLESLLLNTYPRSKRTWVPVPSAGRPLSLEGGRGALELGWPALSVQGGNGAHLPGLGA